MVSVVIIEDEQRIRELLARVLADQGYVVESTGTAMDGLHAVVRGSPDLVVLDMGLPDLDGTELLKMIRAVSDVPIIVATARGEDSDVIRTLDAGADDYLVKPFSVEQLEARVRAVLRRMSGDGRRGQPLVIGDLEIDAAARIVKLGDKELDLSPKEFDLLRFLAERVGEVVSKREILAEVWRQPYGGSEKTVDVHISWLRKKLGESGAKARYLQTVFGVGVKLVDPNE
ncbi:MAG: response regulator transcription factor [Actinobacteria bacterium]|uniref:Phosphate regulon transcriptional regulatory protein PhoB (SphR) n=1 Tax=hydrothermal vent metagenome TaxID=652676 RepID=A0A3B0SX07_9ZZZZ|nr:response regulator transcription factor [Actinomycetota bacterium]